MCKQKTILAMVYKNESREQNEVERPDNACSVFLVTGEEEFHCRPFDAPMPKHIDEVDQDHRTENRQEPEQRRIGEHAMHYTRKNQSP